MKNIFRLFFLLLFFSLPVQAQITGNITDSKGEALPFVNVYIENSTNGTTSNEKGFYKLSLSQTGTHTVVFQFLGFKTVKETVKISSFPYQLDIVLEEETTSLDEVLVKSNENPANKIIRAAINNREKNRNKLKEYTAKFYSRGIWRLEDVPEKLLGQEVGDINGGLDSTRSGIVYLSETVSEIAYKAPDHFKERIIASKVSGDDNGFSMNTALESNSTFYKNTISMNREIISPIADYAFNYYDYKLEGVFYDDVGNLINKIEVIPKRPTDKIFSGHIYIVENTWEIFGTDLKTTGESMQFPIIEELVLNQNFKHSAKDDTYVLISQSIEFKFGMFGFTGNGSFVHVYSDYNFNPNFKKNEFGKEILFFEPEANKKDSIYWQVNRPLPLTEEEREDYQKKDSIQEVRNSPAYKDSVDRARNKFEFGDIISGYSYRNSKNKTYWRIGSPLFGTGFNTVQGWNTTIHFNYRKTLDENGTKFYSFYANPNYGFADERFRIDGGFNYKFNNISRPILSIAGGIKTQQINDRQPISRLLNSITTIFAERNYMKLYDRLYAQVGFRQEIFNGINFNSFISYENRAPLFNSTDHVIIDNEDVEYTSNNPLDPNNFGSEPFKEHKIVRFGLETSINFGQEFMTYPDGKFQIRSNKYPSIGLNYEKGFAASVEDYNFDHLRASLYQTVTPGAIGTFRYQTLAGTFFENENMSFLDYRHFSGRQIGIGSSSTYIGHYNLLPYYELSTNNNYAETHIEHNFDGWLLGKLPLINKLNFNLVIGAHGLFIKDRKPYSEYSVGLDNLGFGKIRFLRLDYVFSFYENQKDSGVIIGLKFLDVFE